MFECPTPRVFAQPLCADFPAAIVDGLIQRLQHAPPHHMSHVTLIVNTSRMQRRIQALFAERAPGFLPRLMLLTDLDALVTGPSIPQARHPLERRLQLAQLIAPVIAERPDLATKSSIFALSDSLATLMDEMQGEGVEIDAIKALDITDEADHWRYAQSLITIAYDYVSNLNTGQDAEARQRAVVERLQTQWAETPPEHPIILAGSTGSRGTTALLMQIIAALPQGAIILPGFDNNLPRDVWDRMSDALNYEDHPQFRFARLFQSLGLDPTRASPWHETPLATSDRQRVTSLALRPAPVTDAWMRDGNLLPDLRSAMENVTLVEAPSMRVEALAIAMRLRMAAETGQRAALITPDRMLTRQVAAALDRWRIVPDDSAGAPLHLSAPGRFLRHVAELFLKPLDAELLLTLLKHPLTQSAGDCPKHGLFTQGLELKLRRDRVPYPDADHLRSLCEQIDIDPAWSAWLCDAFGKAVTPGEKPLSEWLELHRDLAEQIAGTEGGELWDKSAGIAALAAWDTLNEHAPHAGPMDAADYLQLLTSVLTQSEVRDRDEPFPGVMIWGTLEARVQGADMVILGGLNEGVWPETINADPWLNRSLRHQAGLLLPDRKVGLSAHDFQQAFAANEVWITRSVRSDDAETVASRWINRLTNMIAGLPARKGPDALEDMRQRGQDWLRRAEALENVTPVQPAQRAAPIPPVSSRPRTLSVTEIKTLIRDPYAIYARHVLRLRPLDPLVQQPDAPLRGNIIHDIMERFVTTANGNPHHATTDLLMQITDDILLDTVQWPTTRLLWRARLGRVADWVVSTERARMALGAPAAMEKTAQGLLPIASLGMSVKGRADRIDLTPEGAAILYDYKSGSAPSAKEQQFFDKQLLIEAAMIEEGAFETLGVRQVKDAVFISLGSEPKEEHAPLDKEPPPKTLQDLKTLLSAYLEPDQHYLARRMPRNEKDMGVYDHLARFGEWDAATPAIPEHLT